MPLKLIRNDITAIEADAIVNTANPDPVIGAGTDTAIHAAAGPALLEARRAIGPIAPGGCAATDAYDLPARYVLHAVAPFWIDGKHGEAETLRQTYDAALALADRLGCGSVAFPLLAAGSCGFPHGIALSVAIQAFTDFLLDHEITIILALFGQKAFGLASSLFDDLKSYVDDHYVDQRQRAEYLPTMGSAGMSENRRRASAGFKASQIPDAREDRADEELCDACLSQPVSASSARLPGLEEILRGSERTFSESLLDLLRERDGKDSEVYKRAEVSKQLFSKILSSRDYQPTKSTAIQLAIGLQLDLNQTQKLLEKAGYALTRSSKADLVVRYCIERKIYSVTFINEALYDCGLPLLKTGLRQ